MPILLVVGRVEWDTPLMAMACLTVVDSAELGDEHLMSWQITIRDLMLSGF